MAFVSNLAFATRAASTTRRTSAALISRLCVRVTLRKGPSPLNCQKAHLQALVSYRALFLLVTRPSMSNNRWERRTTCRHCEPPENHSRVHRQLQALSQTQKRADFTAIPCFPKRMKEFSTSCSLTLLLEATNPKRNLKKNLNLPSKKTVETIFLLICWGNLAVACDVCLAACEISRLLNPLFSDQMTATV